MTKLNLSLVPMLAEHNAPVGMRDGTILRADVYRPANGGPFPVLLVRTPYGEPMVRMAPVLPAIEAGFAVVLQHCRGTGTSDGEFTPFANEPDDGVDTIEWCARQPWCNGQVGMYGPSYLGMVQFAAAVKAPQALTCLLPVVAPADYHGGLAYRQGALQLGQLLGWYTLKSAQTLQYRAAAGEDVSSDLPALLRHMAAWPPATGTCPPARRRRSAGSCQPGRHGSTTSSGTGTGTSSATAPYGTGSPPRRCTSAAGSTCSSAGRSTTSRRCVASRPPSTRGATRR